MKLNWQENRKKKKEQIERTWIFWAGINCTIFADEEVFKPADEALEFAALDWCDCDCCWCCCCCKSGFVSVCVSPLNGSKLELPFSSTMLLSIALPHSMNPNQFCSDFFSLFIFVSLDFFPRLILKKSRKCHLITKKHFHCFNAMTIGNFRKKNVNKIQKCVLFSDVICKLIVG